MPTPHVLVGKTDDGCERKSDKFESIETASHPKIYDMPQMKWGVRTLEKTSDGTPSKEEGGENITKLNINDILLGRGGHNNKYSGNERLRQIVAEQVDCYAKATKLKKSKMVKALVAHIRSLDPPGRFLRLSETESIWRDAGNKFATEKVSQVFRDAIAKYGLKKTGHTKKAAINNVATKMDPIDLLLSTAEAMDKSNFKPSYIVSKVADPSPQMISHMQFQHMNRVPQHANSINLMLNKGEEDYENTVPGIHQFPVPGIHQFRGLQQYLPFVEHSYAPSVDRRIQKGVTKNSN